MHEGVWFRKNNFWQNDICENLDNFSLMGLLYMYWWCLHGPINFYHRFWWNNLILCLYNVNTLNICMKEFSSEKNNFWQNDSYESLDYFSLIILLYMHRGAFITGGKPRNYHEIVLTQICSQATSGTRRGSFQAENWIKKGWCHVHFCFILQLRTNNGEIRQCSSV